MEKDYSMYLYYKQAKKPKTPNAELYEWIERCFETKYDGKAEDKEEAFKDFIQQYLMEKARDSVMSCDEKAHQYAIDHAYDDYFGKTKWVKF